MALMLSQEKLASYDLAKADLLKCAPWILLRQKLGMDYILIYQVIHVALNL